MIWIVNDIKEKCYKLFKRVGYETVLLKVGSEYEIVKEYKIIVGD